MDYTRTHSARAYNLFDFGKGVSNRGKSKGLYQIEIKLKCSPSPTATLRELRELVSHHPVFQNVEGEGEYKIKFSRTRKQSEEFLKKFSIIISLVHESILV